MILQTPRPRGPAALTRSPTPVALRHARPPQRRHTPGRVAISPYQKIVLLEITVGDTRRLGCCKTSAPKSDGIEPRAEYSNRVREAVIRRLLDDGMNWNGCV